ncbi:MAG: hypothetical protein U0903_13205 [Planctomycetales bacterium]
MNGDRDEVIGFLGRSAARRVEIKGLVIAVRMRSVWWMSQV